MIRKFKLNKKKLKEPLSFDLSILHSDLSEKIIILKKQKTLFHHFITKTTRNYTEPLLPEQRPCESQRRSHTQKF